MKKRLVDAVRREIVHQFILQFAREADAATAQAKDRDLDFAIAQAVAAEHSQTAHRLADALARELGLTGTASIEMLDSLRTVATKRVAEMNIGRNPRNTYIARWLRTG